MRKTDLLDRPAMRWLVALAVLAAWALLTGWLQ